MGITGYYRRFVRNYGLIAKPLTELLKKGESFVWSQGTEAAFNTLKQALMSPPVLALPDFKETFVVETDASGVGFGAVLSQKGHPLAFASKALPLRKRPLSAYEREILAILFAVKQWRSYLCGNKFIIKTDHLQLM